MSQHLGEFEQLLLFALLDLEEQANGAAIRTQIEKRTGRLVSPGAIYTAMDRLEARGFVASRIETTPAELGGRRQKYYQLERAGAQTLERSYRMLSQMARGLGGRLAELASVQRGGRRR